MGDCIKFFLPSGGGGSCSDMGTLFKSELMSRCQLYLPPEAAYNCVAELGELGLAQFVDLNPDISAFQRQFVGEVKRCEEMERKLRYVETEIVKEQIVITEESEANVPAPAPREMVELEASLTTIENNLREGCGGCRRETFSSRLPILMSKWKTLPPEMFSTRLSSSSSSRGRPSGPG